MTNQEFLKSVGMELRVARTRKGMSSEDIAELTGLSSQAILKLEKGECDSKILTYKKLADALEVKLNSVFLTL